ncbi:MAG: CooT family nickel-binding protein [Promethearchaeia archaeon]
MCEFKVKKVNEQDSKLAEDVVVLGYSEEKALILRDIIGGITELDSALIYDVNTLNQTCEIIENPLIHPFLTLLEEMQEGEPQNTTIEKIQQQLEELKT